MTDCLLVFVCQRLSPDGSHVHGVHARPETAHAWLRQMRDDALASRAEMTEAARRLCEQWPLTEIEVIDGRGWARFFDAYDEFRVQPWEVT